MLSFWERETFFTNVDVCIVGAGLVGLSAALHLKEKEPNLNIIVVERAPLPYGASSRNAGFACFGSVSEILEDIKNSDEQTVLALIEKRWRGLQLLKKNVGEENLGIEYFGGNEIFLETEKEIFEKCSDEINALNKILKPIIGSEKIFSNADEKIVEFGLGKVQHLIHNSFEAQINTGKMMKTLLQKVQQCGVQILFGLKIENIINEEKHTVLQTKDFNFIAKKVLICTNGFANQLLPNMDVKPARAQVLITKPINNLKIKATFHYQNGFYYFRNVGNRILFGGGRNLAFEEETTPEIALTDLIQTQLDKILKEIILPKNEFEIDMRWSGIMGVGNEKLPITKWLNSSMAVAFRCNGMGVALGSQTGTDGANLILESGI